MATSNVLFAQRDWLKKNSFSRSYREKSFVKYATQIIAKHTFYCKEKTLVDVLLVTSDISTQHLTKVTKNSFGDWYSTVIFIVVHTKYYLQFISLDTVMAAYLFSPSPNPKSFNHCSAKKVLVSLCILSLSVSSYINQTKLFISLNISAQFSRSN